MRVLFAGTPVFAAAALDAILAVGHAVPLVLTQPDRPAGRGMALQASPVKQLALQHGLPVHQPLNLKVDEARQAIVEARPDAMVVAAYGLILPQAVLDIPRLGCINIHASLLPRWRGAAPIQRAILAGDRETGVTLMRMEAGLDTGPLLARETLPIEEHDTAGTLHDKLAALGARMIVEALPRMERGALHEETQPAEGVTYAAKLDKAEAMLDWRKPASDLARAVRAFNPSPGAVTRFQGQIVKIWQAVSCPGQGAPGTILRADGEGILIACSAGALLLTELQKSGGKRLSARDFLLGTLLRPGERFDLAG